MTLLFNDPADFADEMLEGFVAANADAVRAVPGGVVRRTGTTVGKVAVVVGGGSGHYPAFAGLVGAGLADGAVVGNLFASPSRQQVVSVASSAATDGGVLLTFGNYAGDVLNFGAAQEALRAQGVPCQTVLVTDDMSSASADERHKRRGIAGDLAVFKVAGAAAERGDCLDDVARLATAANDRTRSVGVAFSGCTLPGADSPLFSVPAGRMAVGLGIHGEPGLRETDVPTAAGLAALLVETLLGELPEGITSTQGQRAAVVLNGLGSVKYEELFVVYASVTRLLAEAGIVVVAPEVGEFCTSFDMAGASLTILWLDDELEQLWLAPAQSPAFNRGSVPSPAPTDLAPPDHNPPATSSEPSPVTAIPADPASVSAAQVALSALLAMADTITEHVDELGRIDAVAGDGDHGIGMQRGVLAAVEAAADGVGRGEGLSRVLGAAGDRWADRAGGTSGALWGVMLQALADAFDDTRTPTSQDVARGVASARDRLQSVGKAQLGDKTMVDAVVPFTGTLLEHLGSGAALPDAWGAAARSAVYAAAATSELVPRVGRARPHAQRSVGTPDAGAHSFGLIATAVATVLTTKEPHRDQPLPAH
jgi:dihydroxyacetone kinase